MNRQVDDHFAFPLNIKFRGMHDLPKEEILDKIKNKYYHNGEDIEVDKNTFFIYKSNHTRDSQRIGKLDFVPLALGAGFMMGYTHLLLPALICLGHVPRRTLINLYFAW